MFFMMGITDSRKDLSFTQTIICNICGYETEEDFEYCPKCGKKF